jgi:hypothetical protein
MTRWLLRLYPRWFRDRYGDELADLLANSTHRPGDVLNIAVHAGRLRWDSAMSRPLRLVADASSSSLCSVSATSSTISNTASTRSVDTGGARSPSSSPCSASVPVPPSTSSTQDTDDRQHRDQQNRRRDADLEGFCQGVARDSVLSFGVGLRALGGTAFQAPPVVARAVIAKKSPGERPRVQ